MMAFFVTTPISIRMPITTGIEIGRLKISRPRMAPPIESGSENRMVRGWKNEAKSRISTPSTIIRPAPIAIAKPSNTSPITSASPVWRRETPGGRFFAAGTSNPYFSTDTAATLRGLEIRAEVVAKATSVDGVYDKDPKKHADAVRYETISYSEVLTQNLRVMDASAVAMCRDNKLPIVVFKLTVHGNIMRMARGEAIGTTIH